MHSVGYVFLAAEHCGTIVRLIQPSSCGVCLNFMTEPRSALGTGLIGDRRSKNHWTALQRNHNNPPPPPEEPFRRTVQRCTIVSVRVVSVPALLSPLGFIVQTMREPVHLVLSVMNISPWPGSLAVHCRRWVIHFHNTVNNKHIGSVICVRNYKSGTDFSKGTQVKGDEWTNLNSNATRLRFTHTCQCD